MQPHAVPGLPSTEWVKYMDIHVETVVGWAKSEEALQSMMRRHCQEVSSPRPISALESRIIIDSKQAHRDAPRHISSLHSHNGLETRASPRTAIGPVVSSLNPRSIPSPALLLLQPIAKRRPLRGTYSTIKLSKPATHLRNAPKHVNCNLLLIPLIIAPQQ